MADIKKEKIEETNKDTVEIKKEDFTALMKRLDRLEKTANKGRITNYDNAQAEDQEKIYKLRTIDGRVVIQWSNLLTNEVEINPETKRTTEDQSLEVTYEDKTTEKMSLVLFNRRYQYIYTTLKEETIISKNDKERIEKYGDRIMTLETDDGKEYKVGVKFVN